MSGIPALLNDIEKRLNSNPNLLLVSSDNYQSLMLLLQGFSDWKIFDLVKLGNRTIVRNLEDVLTYFPKKFQKLLAEILALEPPYISGKFEKSVPCDHKQVAKNLLELKSEEAWFDDLQKLKASLEKQDVPFDSDPESNPELDFD